MNLTKLSVDNSFTQVEAVFTAEQQSMYRYASYRLGAREQAQDQIAYILTDTKETIVTENFYQPISLGILKQYLSEGMY